MISSPAYKQCPASAHVLANALELGFPKFHIRKDPPSWTFCESVCQSVTSTVLKSNGTCLALWLPAGRPAPWHLLSLMLIHVNRVRFHPLDLQSHWAICADHGRFTRVQDGW